jgi:high-affinity iron transporter
VKRATTDGRGWGLFWISFLAVLREGIELALFLTAAAFSMSAGATLVGGIMGLGAAAVVGWVFFATSSRLDMNSFFRVTSILLVLFAAGLVAQGIHEFNEAGIVPSIVEHIGDVNPILDEASGLGQILKSLLGYNGNPSLTEVAAYGFYVVAIVAARQASRKRHARTLTRPAQLAACH